MFNYEPILNLNEDERPPPDLKTWITDLPAYLRKIPINQLAIPGSHNGLTYKINAKSIIALDCDDALKRISSISKSILARWSSCQRVSILKQLESGVRYFDLRVEYDPHRSEFWCVHLMKAEQLPEALQDIDTFLNNHPNEILILDFQHFLNFTSRPDHLKLITFLHDFFGKRLCPERSIADVTVEWMNLLNHQIIIVYRHDICSETDFFDGYRFPVVYPISSDPHLMLDSMSSHLAHSTSKNWCLVLKTVMEPNLRMVLRCPFANFRSKIAKSLLPHILTLLVPLRTYHPNVIVADFVELDNAAFPRAIVNLNYESAMPNEEETTSTKPYWKKSRISKVLRQNSQKPNSFSESLDSDRRTPA
ncbi:hypothetical protein GE061_004801 [Apolygus lucorum]|uniref:Phosphatidylinositol-specific phospholipase C X domain-containing protein n=1 Tax=Apolygus lucorum TaxID=248454 RepID=A0A6A4J696_APOLU|nr:hypothetical protein GE061_004801 [Apolygus lucorum]